MSSIHIIVPVVGGVAALTLALVGCATGSGASSGTGDGSIRIVASTDVYGDIAERVGGDLVDVTSIITGPAQDPHSYEASARNQLALSRADLVIRNGGGYDPFIGTLLDGVADESIAVLDATEASGLLDDDGHDHVGGDNEHVWYSLDAVEAIALRLADELSTLDAVNATAYQENYRVLAGGLDVLNQRAHSMEAQTEGLSAAITEPVPQYLLEDVGFDLATPAGFSEAIEEGDDVPPAVLQETLEVVTGGSVALLAYNGQTASRETEAVRAAAEDAGISIVEFAETLPEGMDYLGWMASNLDAIEAALA